MAGPGASAARIFVAAAALATALALPAAAHAGHGLLDHPVPRFTPQSPPGGPVEAGGRGARWELLRTFGTGNPQTDLDFFTQRGNTFVSVGTLAVGPNAGGQSIFQLTNGNNVEPGFVSSHPSASCVSDPNQALGLQHDVEATPKGNSILNTDVLAANRADTQLLVDATDATGRCHDQGIAGVVGAPQGGLEIIDVTDVRNPVVIGATSHIGEAHTVNIDPKRPHIAYAVTSDNVTVGADGRRANEDAASPEAYDLDGFEVVDLSSCMNLGNRTVEQKRAACRPQVFRYRYPSVAMAQGHTNKTGANGVFGCHELEIYPDDRITCGSGNAAILLDTRGAFDDRGTPANFNDDRPHGAPLPCRERDSSSPVAPLKPPGLKIVDCVDGHGVGTDDLTVAKWLGSGAPSLSGVRWVGSAFHQGREVRPEGARPDYNSAQDLDFNHEAEFSHSGRYILSTDERGGGVEPPGASCSAGADNLVGNGGIHAHEVGKLLNRAPGDANDAFRSYAQDPRGGKAIYRARVRTPGEATACTAHVFQQIPGQNRIFMGWYSQGTQVVDFEEHENDRLEFREAGWFIPPRANQWVSHVFKAERNRDDTWTYWGALADFSLGAVGRNTVEIYRVTLPPPPLPRGRLAGTGRGLDPRRCLPRRVRVTGRRMGPAMIGRSYRRFSNRYRPSRRRSRTMRRHRLTRFCVRGGGRFTVGRTRRNRIDFVSTTARRHATRKLRPGGRAPRRIRGARSFRRGLLVGHRVGRGRVIYGVRRVRGRRRVRFLATVAHRSARTAKARRALVRRLRAAGLTRHRR
jgi:hypothetical protein